MSNPRLKPSDYTQQINQNLKIDHITRKIELVTSDIDPSEPPSIKNNDIKLTSHKNHLKEDSGTECDKNNIEDKKKYKNSNRRKNMSSVAK